MQLKNFVNTRVSIFVLCLTFKAVPVPNMKAYGKKEASHHSFLILALERGVWLPSCLTIFPWEKNSPFPPVMWFMEPRACWTFCRSVHNENQTMIPWLLNLCSIAATTISQFLCIQQQYLLSVHNIFMKQNKEV
jgi:hypothetical protein